MTTHLETLVDKYAAEIRSNPNQRNLSPDVVRHMALMKAVVDYVEERFGNNGNNRNNETGSKKGNKQRAFNLNNESNGDGSLG